MNNIVSRAIKRIDAIREKKNLSYYRLAELTDISKQTFTKWMKGKTEPTITTLSKVCDVLEISLIDLLADDNVVELTPEMQEIFNKWKYLSKEEKSSIKNIIDNYAKNKI